MTALPPDPEPSQTAGLDEGGGVDPGDTPPNADSTRQSANKDPIPRRAMTPSMIGGIVAVGLLFAVFLVVAVLYFLQVIGVMDRW
jgi:hypothetical protein